MMLMPLAVSIANGNDSIRLEITGDLRTVVNSKVRCVLNQVAVNDALDSRFLQLTLQIGGKPVVHEVGGHHQHRSFEVPIVQFIGECVDLVLTENDCGLGKNVKIHIRQSPFYFFLSLRAPVSNAFLLVNKITLLLFAVKYRILINFGHCYNS